MTREEYCENSWIAKKLEGAAKESLRARNAQFALEHGEDSDEELIAYVCREAKRLGISPNAGEIVGGWYISKRFGGWKHVISLSGLPAPKHQAPITKRAIFKEDSPNAGEIVGGWYISKRFGGWKHVISLSGLPAPKHQAPITKRAIFKEELQEQRKIFLCRDEVDDNTFDIKDIRFGD